jgi:NAD(P)-dependent dehydrogenase (short-subunit alcohol dehydrogenase family)
VQIPSATLAGRVALVTGAGQGIGKGMALGLATYGADVAALDLDAAHARATAEEIRALGRSALALEVDCRDASRFESAVHQTQQELGPVHVLVNNVGGNVGRKNFLETHEPDWQAALQKNLMPTLYGIRLVAPQMIERGIRGSIINVATIEAVRAAPGYAVYAAAKAGVVSLTQTLALELGEYGIRVNCIAPDITQTPRVRMGSPEQLRKLAHGYPLQRIGQPEDYAGIALYLASDLSAFVTGETFQIGGGTRAAGGWLRSPTHDWVLNWGMG